MPYTVQKIRFGYFSEDIQRILYDLINHKFNGSESGLGDTSFEFTDSVIVFNRQRLDLEETKPVVAILGEGAIDSVEYKVKDPDNFRSFAYEEVASIDRSVYVKVPVLTDDVNKSFRTALRTYDLLKAMFSSKHKILANYGIDSPRLAPSPADISTKKFTVLTGKLRFKARVTVKRDDN